MKLVKCDLKNKKSVDKILKNADIIIAAVGVPNLIKSDMVKEGSHIIDVGINRINDPTTQKGYKVVGDVDYESMLGKVASVTPVPGGVGPMTIACLLNNTVECFKKAHYK